MNFNIKNKFKKLINLKLDFEYKGDFELDLINFKKPKDAIAKLSLDIEKNNDDLKINNFEFKQGKNLFEINNLRLKGENLYQLKN